MQNPSHPSPSHGSDADGSDADGSDVPPPTADAPRTMADGMALLHEVIASLSEALSPEDVARIVAERVRGAIGADSAFVATLAQEGSMLEPLVAIGLPTELREGLLGSPLDGGLSLGDAVRAGETAIVEAYGDLPHRAPSLPADGPRGVLIALPLTVKGRVIGCMGFGFTSPRSFPTETLRLLQMLAAQCAQGLDRANLQRLMEEAVGQMARIQEMTAALGEALTLDRVADVMAEQGVAGLDASSGFLMILPPGEGEETIVRLIGGAADSAARWRLAPPGAACPVADALTGGEMVLVESRAKLEELYPDLAAIDPESCALAAMPIVANGRKAGCVALAFAEARTFSPHEISFMLALAQQCANALERTRLFEAERLARAAAESASKREQFLAEASAQLNVSLDVATTLTNVARSAVPYLADYCTVYLLEEGELRCITTAHEDPARRNEAIEYIAAYPPDPARFHPLFETLRTGEPRTIRNIPVEQVAALARDERERRILSEIGIHAWTIVPLISHQSILGVITFALDDRSRSFSEEDTRLAVELARRAAMALDNARLHDEARRTAEQKREALALLDTFFEASPTGMAVRDLDLRYVRVNAALARSAGMRVEEMIGKGIEESFPEIAPTLAPMIRRAIDTRRPMIDVEITGELPGSPGVLRHWLSSHYPLCSDDGVPYGVGSIVHEITERKSFEQEILASQERFRVAAECASDIVYEWDIASGQVDYYGDVERSAGDEGPDRSFEGWKLSLHPDDRDRVMAAITRHFETGEPFFMEYRVVGSDGTITTWTDRGRLLRNEAGDAIRWVGVMSDITERKRAEDALRESEARFRMLVGSMDDMIFTIDRDQRTTGAFGSWFGLASEGTHAMVGKAPRDIVGPESAALHEAANARALQGERVVYEWSFDTILGPQYLQTSLSPIRNARNEIVGVVGVGHNITERKKAEQRLQESEELSRAILGALTAHIAVIDRNGTILLVNEAWERFGRQSAPRSSHLTGVGANYLDACRKAAAQGNAEALSALIGLRSLLDGTRDQFMMEYTVEVESTQRWFLMNATPLSGNQEGAVITHTEITERKLAELESQSAREVAETASHAKDRFLATLSHELRAPLTPALIMTEWLVSDPAIPERSRGTIEMIRRNIELEAKLIDDLLDYTRIGKGTMELHREEVDAHSMLRNVIQICDEARGSSGRQIIVELDAARHHLHADPVRLQQVFWHLIRNAIRFTPEGGTVIIRTDDAPGGSFRAAITDAGTGFDPEAAATLFDTFGRGAHHYGLGIGLGLSIAKGIVEMHGGTIAASSPGPGKGASFTVELSPLPPEGEEGRGAAASPASGGRVLLVEDHADTRRVLELMLRRWGYEVKAAATVEEGAALAADTTFDLIISDTQLPDGDGEELLRRIDPERKLKAIALGGFGEEEERQRSREAGFAEHIAKPVTTRELLAAIRATLG